MAFWVKDSSGLEVCDFRFRLDPALESARNSEGGAFPDLDARIPIRVWGSSKVPGGRCVSRTPRERLTSDSDGRDSRTTWKHT